MLLKILRVAFLVAGLVLVLLGASWKMWHSPESLWTPVQEQEHAEAWRNMKIAATSGLRAGDAAKDEKLAAAKARFDAIDAKLQSAKSLNNYGMFYLLGAGVISLAISAALFARQGKPQTSNHR